MGKIRCRDCVHCGAHYRKKGDLSKSGLKKYGRYVHTCKLMTCRGLNSDELWECSLYVEDYFILAMRKAIERSKRRKNVK